MRLTLKCIYISDCVFDANVDSKEKIEADVQAHFDSRTKPGTLQFTYDKTANGYKYCFERYLPYGYNADVIIDVDCSFLTGLPMEASQIRRGLSYAAILSKLDSNAEKEQQRTINSQARLIQAEQPREETYSEPQKHNEPSIGIPSLGLFDTTNPVYDPAEEEFRRRMQKKKKKRGPRL